MKFYSASFLFLLFLAWSGVYLCACGEKEESSTQWKGSGMQVFYDEGLEEARPIRLFYFVPENRTGPLPVLMVYHGIERNAMEYRDALISKAKEKGFILVVPEFSEEIFPGTNGYILGNMFPDGEMPQADSLLPQNDWSFSVIPRFISFIRLKTSLAGNQVYHAGHSAGAQFLHRALLFVPEIESAAALVSAAGWYTLPDPRINYPYGSGLTPIQSGHYSAFFQRKLLVQIGKSDNNPNSANLRHTPEADAQGINRFDRAQYFYHRSQEMADSGNYTFQWSLHLIPNLNHDFVRALNQGADLLFP